MGTFIDRTRIKNVQVPSLLVNSGNDAESREKTRERKKVCLDMSLDDHCGDLCLNGDSSVLVSF